ncbi:MAG: hypothetical protein JXK16_00670 [Thiotrichales bacterium]|nr:hypothetical protein [Thiotrichales bacterium]
MNKSLFLSVLFLLPFELAHASADIGSREYKLMLTPQQFAYATESNDVISLIDNAKTTIELAIDRDVTGTPTLEKQRNVRFYDVASSCHLRNMGYVFRERVENGDSEVTLKFRDADRYIAGFEDLSSRTLGATTKLEADIGASTTTPFKVIYSHATTAPNTRTLNNLLDINTHFPGFDADYALQDTLPLSLVGNLVIYERVYKNVMIDLGQFDAEISVTLWYQGQPTSQQSPLIAELSFKYEDANADYTRKVVNRAKQAFMALQTLPGVDLSATTKTALVYQFNPNFCQ